MVLANELLILDARSIEGDDAPDPAGTDPGPQPVILRTFGEGDAEPAIPREESARRLSVRGDSDVGCRKGLIDREPSDAFHLEPRGKALGPRGLDVGRRGASGKENGEGKAQAIHDSVGARTNGARLTTPHKLQAEARSRNRGRRRLVVCPSRKPMAEACQLHAVVRQHASRRLGLSRLGRWVGLA
jgi:hypothetical protein